MHILVGSVSFVLEDLEIGSQDVRIGPLGCLEEAAVSGQVAWVEGWPGQR